MHIYGNPLTVEQPWTLYSKRPLPHFAAALVLGESSIVLVLRLQKGNSRIGLRSLL